MSTKRKKIHTKRPTKRITRKAPKKRKSIFRFLPSIAITLVAVFLLIAPSVPRNSNNGGVLAYATNTTRSGLLSSTNTQRSNNGAAGLTLNSKLNSAAQSKANDMVSRDYWSHETPDGQQPWVFFTAAGYQYLAAGENLAYGYPDSYSTVIGWMNSAPHKANLISTTYTEVGFGIANSSNYVGKGPQTVVVAMYGKPQVASATTSTAPTQSTPTASPTTSSSPKPVVQAKPTETKPTEEPKEEKKEEPIAVTKTENNKPIEVQAAASTTTSKIQLLTNGNAAWSVTTVILAVCSIGALWVIHKGIHVKKYVLAGEHYLARHLHLDLFVLSVVFLGFVLLGTAGVIK